MTSDERIEIAARLRKAHGLYMDDETEFQLSCGHAVWMTTNEPPAYCTECGARVIS